MTPTPKPRGTSERIDASQSIPFGGDPHHPQEDIVVATFFKERHRTHKSHTRGGWTRARNGWEEPIERLW